MSLDPNNYGAGVTLPSANTFESGLLNTYARGSAYSSSTPKEAKSNRWLLRNTVLQPKSVRHNRLDFRFGGAKIDMNPNTTRKPNPNNLKSMLTKAVSMYGKTLGPDKASMNPLNSFHSSDVKLKQMETMKKVDDYVMYALGAYANYVKANNNERLKLIEFQLGPERAMQTRNLLDAIAVNHSMPAPSGTSVRPMDVSADISPNTAELSVPGQFPDSPVSMEAEGVAAEPEEVFEDAQAAPEIATETYPDLPEVADNEDDDVYEDARAVGPYPDLNRIMGTSLEDIVAAIRSRVRISRSSQTPAMTSEADQAGRNARATQSFQRENARNVFGPGGLTMPGGMRNTQVLVQQGLVTNDQSQAVQGGDATLVAEEDSNLANLEAQVARLRSIANASRDIDNLRRNDTRDMMQVDRSNASQSRYMSDRETDREATRLRNTAVASQAASTASRNMNRALSETMSQNRDEYIDRLENLRQVNQYTAEESKALKKRVDYLLKYQQDSLARHSRELGRMYHGTYQKVIQELRERIEVLQAGHLNGDVNVGLQDMASGYITDIATLQADVERLRRANRELRERSGETVSQEATPEPEVRSRSMQQYNIEAQRNLAERGSVPDVRIDIANIPAPEGATPEAASPQSPMAIDVVLSTDMSPGPDQGSNIQQATQDVASVASSSTGNAVLDAVNTVTAQSAALDNVSGIAGMELEEPIALAAEAIETGNQLRRSTRTRNRTLRGTDSFTEDARNRLLNEYDLSNDEMIRFMDSRHSTVGSARTFIANLMRRRGNQNSDGN